MTRLGKAQSGADRQMDLVQSAWRSIGIQLQSVRARVQDEITTYPAPIPACDAHFNHLLEERARIGDELGRADAAAKAGGASAHALKRIDEFLATSDYLDDAAKQAIKVLLY